MASFPFPEGISPETRICFARLQGRLKRQGVWRRHHDIGLVHLATCCSHYLGLLRESRVTTDPEKRALLASLAKQQHEFARELLAQYAMVEREKVHLAVMNHDGEDELIAALCSRTDGLRRA